MTIQPSGVVTGVRATEVVTNAPGPREVALGACVVDVIARLAFSPGPVGGSVTYSFPFLFEPSR